MLKILDGRGGVSWSLVPPEAAEVLIAGTHGDELVARRWAKTDKPLVAVYEGAAARDELVAVRSGDQNLGDLGCDERPAQAAATVEDLQHGTEGLAGVVG
ncbi:MAG TPA: hypothetical protein VM847_21955 [Tahibacter sp.]|nr:hypothetical protein [Tahibacter sp.]